jgi:hypothetical protein
VGVGREISRMLMPGEACAAADVSTVSDYFSSIIRYKHTGK